VACMGSGVEGGRVLGGDESTAQEALRFPGHVAKRGLRQLFVVVQGQQMVQQRLASVDHAVEWGELVVRQLMGRWMAPHTPRGYV